MESGEPKEIVSAPARAGVGEVSDEISSLQLGVRCALITVLVAAAVVLATWLVAWWQVSSIEQLMREELLSEALALAENIHPAVARGIARDPADDSQPEFARLAQYLRTYLSVTPYLGIYTLVPREGELVFGPESYDADDPLASPPGTLYEQPPDVFFEVFERGAPVVYGPYQDEYGTFISALAPVIDPDTGEAILGIGFDIAPAKWNQALRAAAAGLWGSAAWMVVLIIIGGFLMWKRAATPSLRGGVLRHADVVLTAVLGISVVTVVVFLSARGDIRARQLALSHLGEALAGRIVSDFQGLRDHQLGGVARLFSATETLDAGQFLSYVEPLVRRQGVEALEWIAALSGADREDFEAEADLLGIEGFRIWREDPSELEAAEQLRPIVFIEPVAGNEELLGFDLASDPLRAAALDEAARTGLPTAVAPTKLIQPAGDGPGIVLFHPVFSRGPEPTLRGFAAAAVAIKGFLRSTAAPREEAGEFFVVEIHAIGSDGETEFLAGSTGDNDTAAPLGLTPAADALPGHRETSLLYPLFLYGRTFAIAVHAGPGFFAAHGLRAPWVAGATGLLLVGLLTGFVAFASRNRVALESRVRERTRELAAARHKAEEATQAKSAFLATMSHEIRTPLNAIVGMSELLREMPLEERGHEAAETIHSSGEALLSLVNDILDLSKIEAGRLEFERLPVDLQQCLESTVEILSLAAVRKGIELIAEVGPGIPRRVYGDPLRLRQILLNLTANAIKFTAEGEVFLRVEKTRSPEGASMMRFSVRDTGVGIPPDKLDRLFRPFTQADRSTTRQYGGTGLGLSICKRLVEHMGGRIWAESHTGKGSVFYFEIPLESAPEDMPDTRANVLNGRHLLVAAGNATLRGMLKRTAERWGMAVRTTGDGAAAALRSGERIDAAVLALGAEATADAVAAARDGAVPVVVLRTALESHDASGVVAVMSRPVRQSALLQALLEAVGRPAGVTPEAVRPQENGEQERRLRILVAEDNPVNRRVMELVLQKLGYTARFAADGREALDAVLAEPPDLLLLDIEMPELDGFEVTRELRVRLGEGDAGRPVVVALTAHAGADDRKRFLDAGMDDLLCKPVRRGALAALLDECERALASRRGG